MGVDDSGKFRTLTQADLEDILSAQRKAETSANREKLLHGMELKLAELIGIDGDGGEFSAMKKKATDMEARLKSAEEFVSKAKWTVGLLAAGGGFIAAMAMKLVDHWIK